jgi:hypothetical protein
MIRIEIVLLQAKETAFDLERSRIDAGLMEGKFRIELTVARSLTHSHGL